MTISIIGCGPVSEVYPCIPEFLILQTDNEIIKYDQSKLKTILTPKKLDDLVANKQVKLFSVGFEYRNEEWISIEDEEHAVSRFPLVDIQQWTVDRAYELVKESITYSQKEPIKALSVLQIAAKLCKIELSKLVQALESQRKNPSENLADILSRIKSEPKN